MGDILFLAHRVPFPPDRGDRIRSHHMLTALAKLAAVHVGCFSEDDADAERTLANVAASCCIAPRTKALPLAGLEALLAGKPVSLTAFHSRKLERWVRETIAAHDITAIVVFSGQMGQYVPADFSGRVVIDLCDVDSAKFASYAAAGERVWLNTREARLLAAEEERLGARADATLLISEAEAALYRSRLAAPGKVNVQVIGNGIDAAFFDPASVAPHPAIAALAGPHFTFTGQMDYRPNEQAALWVIAALMPALRTRFPQAMFHVVGRNPTARLMAHHGTSGVHIWGAVPDVRPFIAAADAVLAPLLIARGVQNKVLEAMAMARPVVLTPDAATGIAAEDEQHWLVCPPDGQVMAARIDALLGDAGATVRIGTAARRFVCDHHGWDAMLAPLAGLVGPPHWASAMPPDSAMASAPPATSSVPTAWRGPLAALAAAICALIAVTAQAWGAMLHQWWNIDTYNHLLLVPFIVAWLVALKEEELAALAPQAFWPGLVLVAAALGVWVAGEAFGINLVAQAGAVAALQAAVVTILGVRVSALLALPIGFASFLVPFGDEIIAPLQAVTAEIAVTLTHASGVPAQIAGIHIHTPAGLFIVAEACSGVKFLIAMVTLAVLVCFTRFTRWSRRAAFMAACIIVPILANGVRAWATIYIAQFIGAEAATGFDHIVYGWIFFAIIAAALLGGAWRFFDREPEDYGWRADRIARWPLITRAEGFGLAPKSAALAIIALAMIAALAAVL